MMKRLFEDDFLQNFLLHSEYRRVRYVLFATMFIVILVSVVLSNVIYINNLQNEIVEWLAYSILFFGLVGVNVFVLIPRFLLKNRLVAYFIWILVITTLVLAILGYMQFSIQHQEGNPITQNKVFLLNILSSVFTLLFLMIGTSSIILLRHYIKSKRRINELEAATLQSELDMLKNQINPHFLLNTLNNANVLIWKDKNEAQLVLHKLENLLRYQLKDTSKEEILLSFDIRFLNDFLNLEKIRRDNFEFSINVDGDMDGVQVPSLLFIPFVENAVKHNNDSRQLSYVRISFEVESDKLTFYCENSKPAVPPVKNKAGGLGLKNVRRRLELLYPNQHTLSITDDERRYVVRLVIINH